MLGPWGFAAGAVGLLLAWAYSAPPLRLKRNGWWGNAACGLCYEGLAWITGAAVMAGGAMPQCARSRWRCSTASAAHGIMTLNDFKSVQGDRTMGIGSLPVLLGVDGAARAACWVMIAPQVFVVGAARRRGTSPCTPPPVAALIAAQLLLMRRFLRDPTAQAIWYSGFGVPLFVIGMMVSAFALRSA